MTCPNCKALMHGPKPHPLGSQLEIWQCGSCGHEGSAKRGAKAKDKYEWFATGDGGGHWKKERKQK